MTDYISREAAINALGEEPIVWSNDNDYELGERNQWRLDKSAIEATSSADVRENVRGEWIFHETQNDRYDDMICPFCKKSYTVDAYRIDDIGFTAEDFNFCPNCGADMRGQKDG